MTHSIQQAPYSAKEERFNILTHAFGAALSLIGLIAFIVIAIQQQDVSKLITHAIYGVSLCCLFGASAIYHGATRPDTKAFYKLFDHCAIYLLIAGTYTPLLYHTLPGLLGYGVLAMVWLMAIIGIYIKIRYGSQYKKFSVATYLVMGWLSVIVIYQLIAALPSAALTLLGLGGLVYSTGVYFYLNNKILYNHAIWHIFVLIAAVCHYFLMFIFVL